MLSFANATGNLYNRLGKVALLAKQLRSYQLSQLTNMTDPLLGVVGQLDGESDIQGIMGGSYIGILSSSDSAIGSTIRNISALIVNRMVFRDNPRLGQTLTSINTLASLQEIIRQMRVAGASVLAMTITATPTGFFDFDSATARDGVINASTKRPLDGLVLENSFAENLLLTCTQDSYSGGATAYNEPFSLTGTGSETDFFAFDWPLGSNCSTSLNAIDGNTSNGSGNILTNSGFSNWTGNVPNNFSLVLGTAGTNISRETTIVYDGSSSSLAITGDSGGTLTSLTQLFNDSSGTSGQLNALTQYSFNVFVRRDGTIPGAGVLAVELIDQNSNIVQDEQGVNNSFTINLTGLTTVFTSYTGVFRTPAAMPTSIYLRLRLTTALTNGRSVFLDKMSLGVMTQAYVSGPFLAIHSGASPFVQGDYGSCAITNSRGAAGVLDTFQTFFARSLPQMIQNELLLPSSSVPTISDSALIS